MYALKFNDCIQGEDITTKNMSVIQFGNITKLLKRLN